MKTNTFIFLSIFGLLQLTLVSCGSEGVASAKNEDAQEVTSSEVVVTSIQFELGNMELGQLEEHPFQKTINANGFINVPPESFASVSPYFGGYIKEIRLLSGQRVGKGQTLFVLENPEYLETQQSYLEAKSQLNYLKLDYERQKDLSTENVTSKKNYLKAESEYKMILARYESLRKKLQLMGINPSSVNESNLRSTISVASPISGFVTEINASKGLFLNPSDIAVKIMNTDQIYVELSIFEKNLMQIHEKQNVTFRLQNDPTKTFDATIFLINKAIDPKTRTIKVLCKLSNVQDAGAFTPGMYVEAEIITNAAMGFGIPESAIVSVGNESYVLVLKSKKKNGYSFEKRKVKVGQSTNGICELLHPESFDKTKKILINGAFNLINE